MVHTRKAILPDVERLHAIIRPYAEIGTLLPRTLGELSENVRDFVVAVDDNGGIVGCGALHLYGMHLAEIRTIAVVPAAKGRGAGRKCSRASLNFFPIWDSPWPRGKSCRTRFTRIASTARTCTPVMKSPWCAAPSRGASARVTPG
jgi:amino-acid N-acetyltransferase